MRVTNEMMVASSMRQLSTRLGRYQRAQTQFATGQRTQAPPEDPAAAGRSLSLRATQRSREQEARNATDAGSRPAIADGQLSAASERMQRVNEATVRAGSTMPAGERQAIKSELMSIRDELRGIANPRYRGAPLFGGYAAPAEGVAADRSYQGDNGAIERRIGGTETVKTNMTAAEAFGLDGANGTPSVFTSLDEIAGHLDTGNSAAISPAGGRLETARATLGRAQAVIGAAANRVESAQTPNADAQLTSRTERAEAEDVDDGRGTTRPPDAGARLRVDPVGGVEGVEGASTVPRVVPPAGPGCLL